MCESSLNTIYILAGANYGFRGGGFTTKQQVDILVVVGKVKIYHFQVLPVASNVRFWI